jgi:hypothetical protein
MAVVGDEQIDVTVVVVVTGADALSPAFAGDTCLLRDVGKRAVAAVSIQVARRCSVGRGRRQARPVDEKDVRPSVAVVVDDRDAAAGRLENVLLGVFPTDDRACAQTGGCRQIAEVRDGLSAASSSLESRHRRLERGDDVKRRQGRQHERAANETSHVVEEDRLVNP